MTNSSGQQPLAPKRFAPTDDTPDKPHSVSDDHNQSDAPGPDECFINQLVESFRFEDARLPSLPNAVVYLERAIRDDSVSMKGLAQLLEQDPVLATRLIRVANSAYYRGVSPVESVPAAVSRIGFSATQNIALVLLRNSFNAQHQLVTDKISELWSQSLRIAAMASSLSVHFPLVDANRAMLGGLLYNVGAMLLLTKIDEKVQRIPHPLILDHMISKHARQFGLKLLHHWDMDPDLQDVVGNRDLWQRHHSHAADLADLVLVARCCLAAPEDAAPDLQACQQLPCYQRMQQFIYLGCPLEELVANACESVEQKLEMLEA